MLRGRPRRLACRLDWKGTARGAVDSLPREFSETSIWTYSLQSSRRFEPRAGPAVIDRFGVYANVVARFGGDRHSKR